MELLIRDPETAQQLIADRSISGADRFDEVWNGIYVIAPTRTDEHQRIVGCFCHFLVDMLMLPGLGEVRMCAHLVADPADCQYDFRVPDIVVFRSDTSAVCHDMFWTGPPDFVVEITTPHDATYQKLPFYEVLGVRELLIVDRERWRLDFYRHREGKLSLVESAAPGEQGVECEMVPFKLALVESDETVLFVVEHLSTKRTWEF